MGKSIDNIPPTGKGEQRTAKIVELSSDNSALRYLTDGSTTRVAQADFLPGYHRIRRNTDFQARHGHWPTERDEHRLEMQERRDAFRHGIELPEKPDSKPSYN